MHSRVCPAPVCASINTQSLSFAQVFLIFEPSRGAWYSGIVGAAEVTGALGVTSTCVVIAVGSLLSFALHPRITIAAINKIPTKIHLFAIKRKRIMRIK
jgi:hypothetical protein